MKKHSSRSYFYFISLILMITTYLSVLYNNLPPFIGFHYNWVFLWVISLIIIKPEVFRNKLLLFVVLYGIVFIMLAYNIIGRSNVDWEVSIGTTDWNLGQVTREFVQIFIGVSVITYYRIEKDYYRLAKLMRFTLLFILITAIMSIITSLLEPNYTRMLVGLGGLSSLREVNYTLKFEKLGGGGYGFASAIICLFPILIYYYRNNSFINLKRKYILLFVVILFFALIRMQIFANILLSILVIIFSLMGTKRKKVIITYSILFFILVITIPLNFYAEILVKISSIFPTNSDVYFKLNDLSKFILSSGYIETSAGVRAARYPMLIDAFIKDPLLGYFLSGPRNDLVGGGHLYWMNKLTVFGIIGTIPIIYILYTSVRTNLSHFNKEYAFYFLLSIFSIITLGFMKALSQNEMWYMIFIIVPGLYYLPLLTKNKRNAIVSLDPKNRSININK